MREQELTSAQKALIGLAAYASDIIRTLTFGLFIPDWGHSLLRRLQSNNELLAQRSGYRANQPSDTAEKSDSTEKARGAKISTSSRTTESKDIKVVAKICPSCSAHNSKLSDYCWKCYRHLS